MAPPGELGPFLHSLLPTTSATSMVRVVSGTRELMLTLLVWWCAHNHHHSPGGVDSSHRWRWSEGHWHSEIKIRQDTAALLSHCLPPRLTNIYLLCVHPSVRVSVPHSIKYTKRIGLGDTHKTQTYLKYLFKGFVSESSQKTLQIKSHSALLGLGLQCLSAGETEFSSESGTIFRLGILFLFLCWVVIQITTLWELTVF